jgi:hypothetical protein
LAGFLRRTFLTQKTPLTCAGGLVGLPLAVSLVNSMDTIVRFASGHILNIRGCGVLRLPLQDHMIFFRMLNELKNINCALQYGKLGQ